MKQSIIRILSAFGLSGCIADADEKRVVAKYARGNVKLQLGKIMTVREYDVQKRRVLAYDFR